MWQFCLENVLSSTIERILLCHMVDVWRREGHFSRPQKGLISNNGQKGQCIRGIRAHFLSCTFSTRDERTNEVQFLGLGELVLNIQKPFLSHTGWHLGLTRFMVVLNTGYSVQRANLSVRTRWRLFSVSDGWCVLLWNAPPGPWAQGFVEAGRLREITCWYGGPT